MKPYAHQECYGFFTSSNCEIVSYWGKALTEGEAREMFIADYGDRYELEAEDNILSKYGPGDDIPGTRA